MINVSKRNVHLNNEANPSYMHYSFDFAQQIHFLYSSQQPGQLFFRTPRKFGVTCEAKSCQVNYLIDEADDVYRQGS